MNELIAGLRLWQKWMTLIFLEFLPWLLRSIYMLFHKYVLISFGLPTLYLAMYLLSFIIGCLLGIFYVIWMIGAMFNVFNAIVYQSEANTAILKNHFLIFVPYILIYILFVWVFHWVFHRNRVNTSPQQTTLK